MDGSAVRFSLPDPHATVNDGAFCRAVLPRTQANIWLAGTSGYCDGAVLITRRLTPGRFIMDAAD